MFRTVRLIAMVSRAEFLLPNLGSLIMGLAWAATSPVSFNDFVVRIVLSFTIINLSSAIGAQVNTVSDYALDTKDDRKKTLVQALDSFGLSRLKKLLVAEFLLTLFLVAMFMVIERKPILLLMWIAGISLGCAYSAPPLRFKSRSWLAPVSLSLVLAIFPVLFAYFTFTSEINTLFLLSLAGLVLTVYGVIIPTEIRDYFGDKTMGIETLTVHLGLLKASFLSMVLLIVGGAFIGTAFLLEFGCGSYPLLSIFLLAIPIAVLIVFREFKKLHSLSKEYVTTTDQRSVEEKIVSLSAHNPKWIMIITQTYSAISILLLLSKFLI